MVNICPDCGSNRQIFDYKLGEIICASCGLVLQETIFDSGPEWRAFDDEQLTKRSRAGGPLKYAKQGIGLTTEIDRYDRDIKGGSVPTEKRALLCRMRKWQRRSRMATSVDRNLSIALPELDRMSSYLNLPSNMKEEVARIYRKCVTNRVVRGRSIESVIAAIIYLISKQYKLPLSLIELERVANVSKKEIGRSYRVVCRRLGLRMPVVTPIDYVPRLAAELEFSGRTEAYAKELLKRAIREGVLAGKVPISVAAATLYIAGKILKDKAARTFKDASGAPASAIKNRYQELVVEFAKRGIIPEPLAA